MTDTDLRSLTEKAAPPATVGAYLADQLGDDAWRDVSIDLVSGGSGVASHCMVQRRTCRSR